MSKIFISYSHNDNEWKEQLLKHLKVVEIEGYCSLWDDGEIQPGDNWAHGIETALDNAQAAILMISADFLISPFIRETEVPRLLERRKKEGIPIIPLIVKPCAWKKVPWLSAIQARPAGGEPLSGKKENEIDACLARLAEEICTLITPHDTGCVSPAKRFVPPAPEHISTYRLPTSGAKLFGREKELEILDNAWTDNRTHVVTLTAWGGVGKTALVYHWLNRMETEGFRGAQKVYAWSFYSQGTMLVHPIARPGGFPMSQTSSQNLRGGTCYVSVEGKQASADEFMQETLRWFGDPDPAAGSAVEKGRRLAKRVRQDNTLLILDGMEPLQYPPGKGHGMDGQLKDNGLKTLLKELA
ncbi:MAG: toll/interleukin-1 receptor domain-containing protein, partial [bacterium]|nr:toll/interleukin-1 receptor domain-containing protein [bacterium]